MSISVVNLPKENDPDLVYRVMASWNENTFKLTLVDDESAYTTEATEEYISNQCKRFNMSVKKYLEECQLALSQNDTQFTCTVDKETFNFKKQVKTSATGTMKAVFASLKLTPVDFSSTVLDMLNVILNENISYSKEIKKLKTEKESLETGTAYVTQQLSQLRDEKIKMEAELYRRFLILLNSKKRKIKELRLKLDPNAPSVSPASSPVKMETNSEEVKSEFGDVYEEDTDVDEETLEEKIKPSCSGVSDTFGSLSVENENKKSNARTLLDSMSFLDPTIPFDPK